MRAVIFGHISENSDSASKLTIMIKDKKLTTVIWDSVGYKRKYKTYRYLTNRRLHKAFVTMVGQAILGGWKVLNLYPENIRWTEE